MQYNMEDKVFGEMQFNVGWCKIEAITLWGNRYYFKIRTSSAITEKPSETQQQAYLSFKENLNEISEKSLAPVNDFLSDNIDEILEEFGQPLPLALTDLLIPNQVLFFKNGKTAIIFDVAWTDENVVILLEGESIKVDYGYILEGEL